jgi:hypothetical protein
MYLAASLVWQIQRYLLTFNDYRLEEWRLLGGYAVWLLLRTDVSKELSASFIRVTRISELGTTLAVTSHRRGRFYLYGFDVTFWKKLLKRRGNAERKREREEAIVSNRMQP